MPCSDFQVLLDKFSSQDYRCKYRFYFIKGSSVFHWYSLGKNLVTQKRTWLYASRQTYVFFLFFFFLKKKKKDPISSTASERTRFVVVITRLTASL